MYLIKVNIISTPLAVMKFYANVADLQADILVVAGRLVLSAGRDCMSNYQLTAAPPGNFK